MRQMKRFAAIATATVCLGAATSAQAAVPQVLGQNASAESIAGGCTCSVLQFANSNVNGYLIPGNGVLTKSQVWVGPHTEAGQTVRARTFHTTGPATAIAVSEGQDHSLSGLSSAQHLFYDRIPAAAGDVLGARFHTSPLIEDTPSRFQTASSEDLVGVSNSPSDPSLGQSFGAFTASSWRANIMAVYEPDEDGDGYGDVSQDLCPGSPIGAGACSGALLGAVLPDEHLASTATCGYACLRVQKSIDGASTVAPFDGVVVRWRVLGASTGSYRIRTVAPAGGGNYTVLASSDPQAISTEPVLTEKIYSFPTRLPISAGGYVGLVPPATSASQGVGTAGGGTALVNLNDHAVAGTTDTQVNEETSELLYDADIEPDADHDGYGDVTQDSCPGTATVHDGQCPPGTTASPPPKNKKLPAKAPKILSVKPDKKGRYAVKVKIQQAGTITAQLAGKLKPKGKITKLGKAATKRAAKAGTYTLTLKPPKAAREAKVRAKLVVTLAPSGFLPAQASKSFRLK